MSATNPPTNSSPNEGQGSGVNSTANAWNQNQELNPRAQTHFHARTRLASNPGGIVLNIRGLHIQGRIRRANEWGEEDDSEWEEEDDSEWEEGDGAEWEDDGAEWEEEVEPEEPEEPESPTQPTELTDRFRLIANAWLGRLEVVPTEELPVDEFCPICQLEFFRPHRARTNIMQPVSGTCLPRRVECGHIVGDECLNTWTVNNFNAGRNVTCPICRTVLIPFALGHEHLHSLDS